MENDSKIDFKRIARNLVIQALGIHPETLDRWIIEGAPVAEGSGRGALFDLGAVVNWRVKKAEDSRKNIKQPKKEKPESANDSEHESVLKQKIAQQELRKKTRENDEADGYLVPKKEMEYLYFNLGKNVRQNLMSKPQVYGPQCEGKTGFEITTYLLKEFERLCNSISGLEGFRFDDEAQAYEYHEMFLAGFNYSRQS